MRKKPKLRFVDVLHLSELYCEQYREQNLCLSQTQNDYLFRDFVWQYTSTLYWEGKVIKPVINLDLIGY
jgi:hypothetical protein